MVLGSLKAQTPDPLTETNYMDSVVLPGLPFEDQAMQPRLLEKETRRTADLRNAKVFVLDEATMIEMMKQDKELARLMTAAVVKAVGNNIRLCEMVGEDFMKANNIQLIPSVESVKSKHECKCNCDCRTQKEIN